MEFMYLIPFVIIAVIGTVGFFVGRWYAEKNARRLAQVEATPMCKGADVARQANKMAKMQGRIMAPGGTLTSPIEELECVYYRFIVEEQQTRTSRDRKGNVRTTKVWVTVIDASKMVPCGIEDEDGAIEVSLAEAETLLKDGKQQETGWFSDVSPDIRRLIEEEYGRENQGSFWGGQKTLRVKEQVLAVGDKALVVGKVKLIRTSRGVRPRFVKGKEPLLVTDKNDKELRSHFAWAAWWGKAGQWAGAGCGGLALIGVLVVGIWATIAFFSRASQGGGSNPPAQVNSSGISTEAEKLLQAYKSPDEWTRRREIEPLHQGPNGDRLKGFTDADKAALKKALWELMGDKSGWVVEQARVAMPNWADASDEPQLLNWLEDKREHVSPAAALALAKIKSDNGLPKVQARFLRDPNAYGPAMTEYGAKAEASLRDYLAKKGYVKGRATDGRAAEEACKKLGEIGTAASLPVLEETSRIPGGIGHHAKLAADAIKKKK